MRICLLGDAASIHLRRIARGLLERGHRVHVVCHKPAEIPGATVEKFAVPAFGWRYPRRWEHRRTMFLKRIMRTHDVVHLNFLHDWGLNEEVAGAGRLLASPWGSDIVKPPDLDAYPPDVVAMRRAVLRMARRVVVYGRCFADTVAAFGDLPRERITCAPLGVDLEFFRPAQETAPEPAVVGYFKGFKPVYGPATWIRAIPKVLAALPQTRFEFVGAGPIRGECHRLAHSLGVGGAVQWLPFQPDEAMPKIIGRWKLSVIPSFSESFCVAALESQAMQVPVVASRVGGLLDTVNDGVTGRLVPPGDADAFADATIGLLKDESARAAMGVAGREWVRREYEWAKCVDRLIEIYGKAVESETVLEASYATTSSPPTRATQAASSSGFPCALAATE